MSRRSAVNRTVSSVPLWSLGTLKLTKFFWTSRLIIDFLKIPATEGYLGSLSK